MAVASRDESVDPVGACVGLKGSRVQAVVSELSGERIDIVPWHPDPEIFARRALAPARVAKVISDQERHVITAIVDEDQLSLAIGRNGQNVRLASQLIGWQIDLYSSRDWMERGGEAGLFGGDDEYEMSDFPLSELEGIAPATLAALEAAGIGSFYGLLDMDRSDFRQVPGSDPMRRIRWRRSSTNSRSWTRRRRRALRPRRRLPRRPRKRQLRKRMRRPRMRLRSRHPARRPMR